eukprot:6267393-Pyramimonas_sp.AAC.1
MLYGHRRVRRAGTVSTAPLQVEVVHLKDDKYDNAADVLKVLPCDCRADGWIRGQEGESMGRLGGLAATPRARPPGKPERPL